ncbi:hypothetical protein ABT369_05035 [Dactylosporangium sp. NPDC000244]|uniref:hypothetical protein n=1 Tax=Dactylosporangium sp. NPDC000244 TaxID=3154365 RepID=UPI00333276B2
MLVAGSPIPAIREIVEGSSPPPRAEAHVRYHARHAAEASVGSREIGNPDQPHLYVQ